MAAVKKVSGPTDREKNVATLTNYLLPFILLIYLGLVLRKYTLTDFNGLVTNDYLLLGFKNVDALRKHLVDNLIGSCIWGLTYMYIRKWANPEFREKTWKYRQDGYFATLAVFVTNLAKAVCNNIAAKQL